MVLVGSSNAGIWQVESRKRVQRTRWSEKKEGNEERRDRKVAAG